MIRLIIILGALYFAVSYIAGILSTFVPLIIAAFILTALVKKQHPSYSFIHSVKVGLPRLDGNSLMAIGVILGTALGVSVGVNLFTHGLSYMSAGEILEGLMSACIGGAVAGGAFLLFNSINKGEIAMAQNIFDLVDDKPAFNDFIAGNSKPVVLDINPERDIPLIKEMVIGQDAIVEACVQHIARMARREVRKKPLGVFLAVGSSGAGKTELAKAIAKVCFEGRMTEHFVNQMKSESDLSQLFGSPPGYMGSDKGGKLTQDVKKLRSGVILLDEIEKGHKSIFDAIMTLLDEGKMTDASSGETIDATNFVVIMTSNAEQKEIGKIVQEISDPDDQSRAVKDKLQSIFKPEQLARMSIIAPFKPLTRSDLTKIIGKFILKFAADNKVQLVGLSHELLVQLITRHEKNSDYGIRNLILLIEKDIEDGMADAHDAGFKKVRINMMDTGKFDKSGEPEKKPIVVGVPEETETHEAKPIPAELGMTTLHTEKEEI